MPHEVQRRVGFERQRQVGHHPRAIAARPAVRRLHGYRRLAGTVDLHQPRRGNTRTHSNTHTTGTFSENVCDETCVRNDADWGGKTTWHPRFLGPTMLSSNNASSTRSLNTCPQLCSECISATISVCPATSAAPSVRSLLLAIAAACNRHRLDTFDSKLPPFPASAPRVVQSPPPGCRARFNALNDIRDRGCTSASALSSLSPPPHRGTLCEV